MCVILLAACSMKRFDFPVLSFLPFSLALSALQLHAVAEEDGAAVAMVTQMYRTADAALAAAVRSSEQYVHFVDRATGTVTIYKVSNIHNAVLCDWFFASMCSILSNHTDVHSASGRSQVRDAPPQQ